MYRSRFTDIGGCLGPWGKLHVTFACRLLLWEVFQTRVPETPGDLGLVDHIGAIMLQFIGMPRLFVCSDPGKFAAKTSYATSLLDRAEMLLIGEAHGTEGGNKAWRPPIGTEAWWSAGPSTAHAGVGIIFKKCFLNRFTEAPKWKIICPGRAAMLSLRGAEGALDILVGYFHTGGAVQELDKSGVHPECMEYCTVFPALGNI